MVPGRLDTVHSVMEMMTRFLGLGFTLAQVVTMGTANPAKPIGAAHRLRSLAVGREADVSVLDVREGDSMVSDILGAGLPRLHARLGPASVGLGARRRVPRRRTHPRWLLLTRLTGPPGEGRFGQDSDQ